MKAITALACGLVAALSLAAAEMVPLPELGLRVARGFSVSLFAENDLAPDTWRLTLDGEGRVVVANGRSIQTLIDDDEDGVAEEAQEFARVQRGVMGLCFDGTSLLASADGWLLRFHDEDDDGVADGPPERLLPLEFGEHGAHAIRQGPDGWWYVMAGNDAGVSGERHSTLAGAVVTRPEAGALIRLTPDLKQSEILAHGFRNAYDFDFNSRGDLFTYDSDVERDAFLPWYLPTRVYQIGHGQHHGWRLPGYQRSWPRPDYYADTMPILARVGRGSPTGVTCYRHWQFPEHYRDGLFFADWTFGKVYFLPLSPGGAGYAPAAPEVFIEPIGTHGFAPTSLAVAPDGALYIAIGGRKTRGAVYRVAWTGAANPPDALFGNAALNNVLVAPQPLEAWSRNLWRSEAESLGVEPLGRIVADESLPSAPRVRAIEVMTEVFGGVPAARMSAAATTRSAEVRARLAWSLGHGGGPASVPWLLALANDEDAAVRRSALDAIADQITLFHGADLLRVTQAGFLNSDKLVRLAAVRVASRLDEANWQQLSANLPRNSPAVIPAGLAHVQRTPEKLTRPEMIAPLTNLLAQVRDPAVRLDAVRLIMLALGDWHLRQPAVEVHTGYELAGAWPEELDQSGLRHSIRALLPSGLPALDMEAARLLAMLEDDAPRTAQQLAAFLTAQSDPSADFHYLACLSRLRGLPAELAPRLASAVLALDRKLAGQESRVKQNWNIRLAEVVEQLARREPAFAAALVRSPQFGTGAHVSLAGVLDAESKLTAARKFLAMVKAYPTFPWSPELVALLSLLPPAEVTPYFRQHWNDFAVRDEILIRLAAAPLAADRSKFLVGLGSAQPATVRASLAALLQLPPDPSGTNLVAPLNLLRRSLEQPGEAVLRGQVVTLITNSLKRTFRVEEPKPAEIASLRRAYEPFLAWLTATYPGLARAMNADDNSDPAYWNTFWAGVPWAKGQAERGERIYLERGCAACHGQAGSLGPDLAGAAQRLSAVDLLNAVVFPSRDIAPAYRSTTFRLRNGESHTGLVAFESADGWIVQTGAGVTVRVNSAEVVSREPGSVSLMPSGLLNGLGAQGVADLYAYLRGLSGR